MVRRRRRAPRAPVRSVPQVVPLRYWYYWEYTRKAVQLVGEYRQLFPELFEPSGSSGTCASTPPQS